MDNRFYLFHYYEKSVGPFRNLSDLPPDQAELIQDRIRSEGKQFASKRSPDYLTIRRQLEAKARELFIHKGGMPVRISPHYMTIGACPWIKEWYENGEEICIHINEFADSTISFTYGDLFPTMRFEDGKIYRKQVYTKDEIYKIIDRFGMPQLWNHDGSHGPERYIEAQIWDDKPIMKLMNPLETSKNTLFHR
jgi:hypothetical protein